MLTRKVTVWSTEQCKHIDTGMETIHVGRSLYVANETVQIMSDVWDTETFLYSICDDGTLSRDCVQYCDSQTNPTYEIDATDEAFELYRAKQEADKYTQLVQNTDADYANPAVKGRIVKVVGGRNTPKGLVGKVVVVIERPYGMGYRSSMRMKLGIATSPKMVEKVMPNGKVFQNHADMAWVWAHNCEVESPKTADLALCRQMAQDFGKNQVFGLRKRQEEVYKYNAQGMRGYNKEAAAA